MHCGLRTLNWRGLEGMGVALEPRGGLVILGVTLWAYGWPCEPMGGFVNLGRPCGIGVAL